MPIEVQHLTVQRLGTQIVRDVAMHIPDGKVAGLFGPSGAGKSTLFESLIGEVQPSAGTVAFGGKEVTHTPPWRKTREGWTYLPQTPALFYGETVEQNLKLVIEALNPSLDWQDIARRVELHEKRNILARNLSAGEKRKLEFARVLCHPTPTVILCDEPFSGLDPQGVEAVGKTLRAMASRDTIVLISDHHVEKTLELCDLAFLMLDGTIVLACDAEEFRDHPWVRGRYLAEASFQR